MALQVWLPLMGNLENKGLAEIKISNLDAAVSDTGKIGKCYSFGSGSGISLVGSAIDSIFVGGSAQFSICMWAYHGDTTRGVLFGNYDGSTSTAFNFEFAADHKVRFYWRSASTDYKTSAVAASTWVHLTVTYNGTEIKTYYNGALEYTKAETLVAMTPASQWYLGRDYRTGTVALNGMLNDFRIYDHCLSDKEVHEIAKGLILHYPLDDPYLEPTTNLTGDEVSSPERRTVALSTYAGLVGRCECGNNKVTYSAYIYNTSSVRTCVRLSPYNADNTSYTTFYGNWIEVGAEGWSSVTVDLSDTSAYSGRALLYLRNGSSGSVPSSPNIDVQYVQVEAKDHRTPWVLGGTSRVPVAYDCSGYGNDGTIIGNLSVDSDARRYDASTVFGPAASSAVRIPVEVLSGHTGDITVALWVKIISWNTNYATAFMASCSNDSWAQIAFGILRNNNYQTICFSVGNTSSSTSANCATGALETGVWYHIVAKYVSGSVSLYLNGEQVSTYPTSIVPAWSSVQKITIGMDNYGTHYQSNMAMDDFRIYATALSAKDIAELYNVGQSVDNKLNIHAYSYDETGVTGTPKFRKNGIIECKEILDGSDYAASVYANGDVSGQELLEI